MLRYTIMHEPNKIVSDGMSRKPLFRFDAEGKHSFLEGTYSDNVQKRLQKKFRCIAEEVMIISLQDYERYEDLRKENTILKGKLTKLENKIKGEQSNG
jgi:hypothetical protein